MSDKKEELKISEILRKVVNTGVGAAFMTEDAVKGILSELPLSKDILNGLLQNARDTKTEFIKSIKSELQTYLNRVNVSDELEKLADKYDFEVKATISLKRKEEETGE